MYEMPGPAAEELGRHLRNAEFRPLPEVDDAGRPLGVRLWRVRAGYVEYLALRRCGLAHAVRAVADFDYRRPFDHGPVVEDRFGHATNALHWLLATTDRATCGHRPYVPAPRDMLND